LKLQIYNYTIMMYSEIYNELVIRRDDGKYYDISLDIDHINLDPLIYIMSLIRYRSRNEIDEILHMILHSLYNEFSRSMPRVAILKLQCKNPIITIDEIYNIIPHEAIHKWITGWFYRNITYVSCSKRILKPIYLVHTSRKNTLWDWMLLLYNIVRGFLFGVLLSHCSR
jgi:hypothetical protein